MIVPMKKATVVIQTKDSDSAIQTLRSLGLMHIEHQQVPKGKEVAALQEDIALIDAVIKILSEPEFSAKGGSASGGKNTTTAAEGKLLKEWKGSVQHIIELRKRLEYLGEYSRNLAARLGQLEVWGDFDPELIKKLSENGVYVKLYQIPKSGLKNIPSDIIVKRIFSSKGSVGCVLISRRNFEISFPEVVLPKLSLSRMRARLAEDGRVINSVRSEIRKHAAMQNNFIHIRGSLLKELEFREALRGMGEYGELSYVVGYIPYDAVNTVFAAAKKERWGIIVKDPGDEDNVPTLVRNPKWISIISPVFKLIEIVPGYRELDISLSFLVFFSIFFGMLIGDAGYGLVFLLLTAFAHKKFRNKFRDNSIFILFYILSACAVIWGLLTGTFFGQEWLGQFVKPLFPALRDDKNVQAICFFIGATHLTSAHLWRAVVKSPSVAALSDVGWALILWGGFFLAKTLILGAALPLFIKWLFAAGAILVVLFTNPNRNVLKGVGLGLGALLLNLVNSFTDVVSYIRLFAVGLATVAVADSFNKMAMGLGYGNFLTGIATSLVLLLGHGLNILLGPMSVLVHGVRLNVLEFCNHIDIKWSGFSYNPLRKG